MYIVEYGFDNYWVGVPERRHWHTASGLFAPAAEFATEDAATAFMLEHAQPEIQRELGPDTQLRVTRVDTDYDIASRLITSGMVN